MVAMDFGEVEKSSSLESTKWISFMASRYRNEEIRTLDPIVPNDMRYQTALHSEKFFASANEEDRPRPLMTPGIEPGPLARAKETWQNPDLDLVL